jgi:protocadherin Fat 1/2/3
MYHLEFEEAEYQVPLSDDARRGQFVGKVRAVDLDEGGLLIYSIIGGNKHDIFTMNSTSGTVSLVNLHSFGQKASYSLNVSVSDGVHSSTAKMKVNLVSSNSFAPTFEKQTYEVVFDENQAKGVQVGFLNFL